MGGTSAVDVIAKLRQTFCIFGLPHELVTDNGPPFGAAEFINFCQRNGISPLKSPPYVPQANGLAERAVQTVKKGLLKSFGSEMKCSLDELHKRLTSFLLAYRTTPSSVTLETPSNLLLKFEPRTRLMQLRPEFGSTNMKGKYISNSINLSKSFIENQEVYMRLNDNHQWEPAQVLKVLGLRRYLVKTGDQIRIVHQQQLRSRDGNNLLQQKMEEEKLEIPISERFLKNQDVLRAKEEDVTSVMPTVTDEISPAMTSDISGPGTIVESPSVRRSTRERREPERLMY